MKPLVDLPITKYYQKSYILLIVHLVDVDYLEIKELKINIEIRSLKYKKMLCG